MGRRLLCRPAPRRVRARWRLAVVLVLIMLVPTLSGCLTLDELLASRKKPPEADKPAEFRVWFAARPDALPDEFRHFNLTLGAIVQLVDIHGDEFNLLEMKTDTIDLGYLTHEKKATLVAEGTAEPGLYFGVLYNVREAELGIERVVGNKDGEPVTKVEPKPIVANDQPANIHVDHYLYAGQTTDLYVEYDPARALVNEGNGAYSYTHGLYGVSIYVDGQKVKHHDLTGRDARDAQRRYYGDVSYGDDTPSREGWSAPTPRMRVTDAWDGDLTTSARIDRLVPRSVGLGETLNLDIVHNFGRVRVPGEVPIEEVVWDFADGTRALSPKVTKEYDSGGIYDISMRTREASGRVSTDFVTVFVPYRPDEALATEEEARAGTLLVSAGPTSETELPTHDVYDMTFPSDQAEGRWDLGGYRVTLTFSPPVAEDEDRFLKLTKMRLNVTSGLLQESVVGQSPIVLETAGIPKNPGAFVTDWVEEDIHVGLSLAEGTVVDYDLKVEALYFANLSRGMDHHGQHRHGTWHFLQPYTGHLAYDGSHARPLPGEGEDDDGGDDGGDDPLPPPS